MAQKKKLVLKNQLETVEFETEIIFDRFSDRSNTDYDVECFSPPSLPKIQLRLKLLPNSSGTVILQLKAESLKKRTSIVTDTTIVNRENEKVHLTASNKFYDQDSEFNIFSYYRSKVLDAAEGLLVEDVLTFHIAFTITAQRCIKAQSSIVYDNMQEIDEMLQVIQDMEGLLKFGPCADVQFNVPGKKQLSAHKAILMSRSKVFAGMFKEEMEVVNIEDIEVTVFEQLLVYLYTGKIAPLGSQAEQLFVAADKYDFPSLKATCEEYLCTQISPQTVHSLLLLADQHGAPKLKALAMEYFKKNTADAIDQLFDNNHTEQLLKAFRDLALVNGLEEADE